jgi:hypothetical protein
MKKHYSKPQVDVIVMSQQPQLLAGSDDAKASEKDWDPEYFDKP